MDKHQCPKCGVEYPVTHEFFRPHKRYKSGYRLFECLFCEKNRRAERYIENGEHERELRKERYYQDSVDPEKLENRRLYNAKWQSENREKYNAYMREYRARKKQKKENNE